MKFISVLYFEGYILAFTEDGEVRRFGNVWTLLAESPTLMPPRARFVAAVPFEGQVRVITEYGDVWNFDPHEVNWSLLYTARMKTFTGR